MLNEIWKDITGFSRYQVSNLGRVKAKSYITKDSFGRISNHKERILSTKPWIQKSNGRPYYIKLKLVDDNGEDRTVSVHILVAKAFIPNPDNKPEVNHIDQNRANNSVSNLEWVTKRENMKKHLLWKLKDIKNWKNKQK